MGRGGGRTEALPVHHLVLVDIQEAILQQLGGAQDQLGVLVGVRAEYVEAVRGPRLQGLPRKRLLVEPAGRAHPALSP